MTIFIKGPDFQEGSEGFNIPYGCAFSPLVRLAIKTLGADIKRHIEAIVEDIDSNEKIASSLKAPSEFRSYRQVDLKKEDGSVLMKCMVEWGEDGAGDELWIVFIEGASETFWEDQWRRVPEG